VIFASFIPLSYNIRSLTARKTTSIATGLGIALVVFVVASSQMLSNGIRQTMSLSGSPTNAMVLRKGSDNELSSSIEVSTVSLIMAAPGVKKNASGSPMGSGEVAVVIAMDKLGTGTDGQVSNVQVRGVPAEVMATRTNVKVIEGRPAQPGTDECVIGKSIWKRFKGLDLNQTFDLKKNRPIKVVGVFEAQGSSFESEIWVDVETLRTSFGREGLVSSVTVVLESKDKFEAFATTIESDKRLGLEAMRESAYFEKQSEDTAAFMGAMGGLIAFFFSIGAMIGAMITMYAAVAQRGREIGTLQALGFQRHAILLSFLFESTLLALAGALIGALAALAMSTVQFSMMNFATWQEISFSFTPTPAILIQSMIAGGVMGILGGLFPAVRAARMSPIAAIRD
jgi:putative ABC transport system permease protein